MIQYDTDTLHCIALYMLYYIILCYLNVWLHVSTNYLAIFRPFKIHEFQNHDCKLYCCNNKTQTLI